ncbi:MAG: glycosyltransferase family 4 protein, partial [candidate division WOR-3 bacterium]
LYKFYKFKNWLKNFDCFISASFSLSNLVKKFYNVDSFVIYNGLDFKSMPEIKRERNDKVLLWIGRSAWIKGLDNFLKLMELLPEYEGWILGVENKNYKNIKFFGYQKDVYNYISKAKAVVITSYYEAFSYVTLESLYYGVPVLSLKSAGGVFEILQILNKYEWIFDDIYQMAEFIKNNEIEDYKIDYLFNELFDFERNYLRLKKIIEML